MPDTQQAPVPPSVASREFLNTLSANWPKESRELIRMAIMAGAKARKTSEGHVLLTSTAGKHATISPAGLQRGNRSHANNASHVRQLIRELEDQSRADEGPVTEEEAEVAEAMNDAEVSKDVLEQLRGLRCPVCKPPRQFLNEEALDAHMQENHVRCQIVTDGVKCNAWLKNKHSLGPHKSVVHSGFKPWEHKKAAREKRDAAGASKPEQPLKAVPVSPLKREMDSPTPESTLMKIRALLGTDPRLDALKAENLKLSEDLAVANKRADDAEARIALMRQAFQDLS